MFVFIFVGLDDGFEILAFYYENRLCYHVYENGFGFTISNKIGSRGMSWAWLCANKLCKYTLSLYLKNWKEDPHKPYDYKLEAGRNGNFRQHLKTCTPRHLRKYIRQHDWALPEMIRESIDILKKLGKWDNVSTT